MVDGKLEQFILSLKLDQSLVDDVLGDMPSDLSLLEKVIFVYVKLCRIFVYDPEFFASLQQDGGNIDHRTFSRIPLLNKKNNVVACYELSILFYKFINMLGYNCKLVYGANIFDGHPYNIALIDDENILFDPVPSILYGDLFCAKRFKELRGIRPCTDIEITKDKIKSAINKVYGIIDSSFVPEKKETFTDVFNDLRMPFSSIKGLTIDTRMKTLILRANESGLTGIDLLSYILSLKHVLFYYEESICNISIVIVRRNDGTNVTPCAVITTNEDDLSDEEEENNYFIYDTNHKLSAVDKDDIKRMFKNGELEYISVNGMKVPGIKLDIYDITKRLIAFRHNNSTTK